MAIDTLKHKKRFSSTIPFDLNERLDNLSKKTMIPKARLIEKALELLLKQYKESGLDE